LVTAENIYATAAGPVCARSHDSGAHALPIVGSELRKAPSRIPAERNWHVEGKAKPLGAHRGVPDQYSHLCSDVVTEGTGATGRVMRQRHFHTSPSIWATEANVQIVGDFHGDCATADSAIAPVAHDSRQNLAEAQNMQSENAKSLEAACGVLESSHGG
jgi:hypothetical protein